MYTKILGCVALAAAAVFPAFGQETRSEGCSFDGAEVNTSYVLPKLGIEISPDPNAAAWGSCSFSEHLTGNVWGSTDLPINDDGVNQGLEIDLYGVATFGDLAVTFGTYLYPEIEEHDLVLGVAYNLGGFTLEANRYENFSNTTSLGIMTPAFEVGIVEFSFGAFHNIERTKEYQSLPVTATILFGDHWALSAVGFIRSDDQEGGALKLVYLN